MKFYYYGVIISLLLVTGSIYSIFQTITQPGRYTIGSDISYTPVSANDSIFSIQSNNVILDLNNHVFTQSNLTTSVAGVVVGSGLTNVTIANGIITNLTGTGVLVNQGCSNITLENLLTFSCDLGGIGLSGSSGAQITDSVINNCAIRSCCQGINLGGQIALSLLQCARIQLSQIVISNNQQLSTNFIFSPFIGLRLNSCSDCSGSSLYLTSNVGDPCTIVQLNSSSNCVFKNCILRDNNIPSTGQFGNNLTGIGLIASSNNIFDSCIIIGNPVTVKVSLYSGIDLGTNANNNLFNKCLVMSGTSINTSVGFNNAAAATANIFSKCIAAGIMSQVGGSGNSFGFRSSNASANQSVIDQCLAINQKAGAQCVGMLFNQGNQWEIKNCLLVNNLSVTSGTGSSFGINNAVTTNLYLFIDNIAFNNGTTAANQLFQVPASSVTTPVSPGSSNISGVSVPWTNIALDQ